MDLSEHGSLCQEKQGQIAFPHLVTTFCKQAQVPMRKPESCLQQSKLLIREPSQEHLVGNRKRKKDIKSQPHLGTNVLPNLE